MENAKAIIQSVFRTLLMKILFSTGGLIAVGIILIIIIVASILPNDDDFSLEGGGQVVSESVLQWKDDIAKEVERQGMDKDIVIILLAILQQESGGNLKGSNGDIFQASESKCGQIGCITDPKESIEQGVKQFKRVLKASHNNIKVAIQSYNFGIGFADYAQKQNDGKYSKEIAIAFSKMQMQKVANPSNYTCIRQEGKKYGACYGDILYVSSVMKYVGEIKSGKPQPTNYDGELGYPLKSITVTSEFGRRIDPITGEKGEDHHGIDLACTEGVTKVYASADGEVLPTNHSSSLGNYVVIKHDDHFYTGYAHMSQKIAQPGEIKQGDPVGICGSSGSATGPHLHFTVQNDDFSNPNRKNYNPRNYLDFGARVK
ncbi:peptidase M23-like protein [Scopulibacillus darangshiensis]|uniref:Peptidase M23-like protein n=1 Tax=Scopulibacillus darangshiensis TaxID=442528 RepID=A0A4R2NRK6_9BACL|nr:lysozyme family protein [Scopulibacillus darangshiensis]TCP24447.1 peptidase M23-like protein [Scopulibacillus darangshiensis]